MAMELKIDHCPNCGSVYQKNMRNLCTDCSSEEDRLLLAVETVLKRNRMLSNEEVVAESGIPDGKLRSWIRAGKIRLADHPNLADQCDLCKTPIRNGHLCGSCTKRIKDDIHRAYEQERLMKERLRAVSSYISKR